jgi:hypothetical protein
MFLITMMMDQLSPSQWPTETYGLLLTSSHHLSNIKWSIALTQGKNRPIPIKTPLLLSYSKAPKPTISKTEVNHSIQLVGFLLAMAQTSTSTVWKTHHLID